ncbi:MAG: hypothetical protein ACTSPU_09350 [Promethearchaeota archaeon]
MNKSQILKIFKNSNSIKKTILKFKTDSEIKKEMIIYIKDNYKSNITNKPITETEIKEHLKETDKLFLFRSIWKFKNDSEQETTIKNLSYDIKTTSIKQYDKLKGNWFKTDFAKYEIKGDLRENGIIN